MGHNRKVESVKIACSYITLKSENDDKDETVCTLYQEVCRNRTPDDDPEPIKIQGESGPIDEYEYDELPFFDPSMQILNGTDFDFPNLDRPFGPLFGGFNRYRFPLRK